MYDYVIVGAGSAGCVLAARLSEDPDVKVLLLESGPPDTNENIHVPLGYLSLGRTEVDWDLETAPEPFCDSRRIKQPRRLRRLGDPRVVVRRPAAVLHQGRGQRARRERVPWRRRAAAGVRQPLEEPDGRGVRRGGRGGGLPGQRRLQRRRAGRLRHL